MEQFASENGLETPPPSLNGLPSLELPGSGRTIGAFATELGKSLASKDIFVRDKRVFTLDAEAQQLEVMSHTRFRTWVENHVCCVKTRFSRSREDLPSTMTEDTARTVLASPQFLECLRRIERLHPCPMPINRSDGSLVLSPDGYDAESGTFTLPTTNFTPDMSLTLARETIEKVFAEFPFAEDGGRSKAVAVAAMLTVFSASIMEAGALRPVFLYLGNAEGTGKTTAAKLAGIAYGSIAVESAPTDDAEWKKKLLSAVIAGRRVILLDNLKGHLNSGPLEAYISTTIYGGRLLHQNNEFSGEACSTILITGNGLTVTPDMRRRMLVVELFTSELRSENRHFDRVLDDVAFRELKPEILAACWTFVKSWHEGGRPKASRKNASFPRWCDTIGGIVEHAGFSCPTIPAELDGKGDTDTVDIQRLATAMKPQVPYSFSELTELCADHGIFERFTDAENPDGNDKSRRSIFSKILGKYDRRRVLPEITFFVESGGRDRRYVCKSDAV